METITIGDIDITIVRSKRRTLELQIKPSGAVMRVPKRCSYRVINDFANQRSQWLQQKMQQVSLQITQAKRDFIDGESFDYLGQAFTLQIVKSNSQICEFISADHALNMDTSLLRINVPPRVKKNTDYIRRKLIAWYQERAYTELSRLTELYAMDMGLEYKKIKVRDYKARWGSCSATGELAFNWRIIMAPPAAVDYVIIHELAHLQHFNHSRQFWQLVASQQPDYQQQKEWFQRNRLRLLF